MTPVNHNIVAALASWNSQETSPSSSCFGDFEVLREEQCADPAFFAAEAGLSHWLCCSAWMQSGLAPLLYLSSVEGPGTYQMLPREPEAFCAFRESSRLFSFYSMFAGCVVQHGNEGMTDNPQARVCLENCLAEIEMVPVDGGFNETMACWPSSVTLGSGAHARSGWRDVWAALHLVSQLPAENLASRVMDLLVTVNTNIWEVNEMLSGTVRSRFRPALASMASASSLHHQIMHVRGPHRGDVLLRLLRELDVTRRAPGSGLLYVELGVAYGHLASWLATHAAGVLGTMHLVDAFDTHTGFDMQLVDAFEELVANFRSAGVHECRGVDPAPARAALCGPNGLQVRVHSALSWEAAERVEPESAHLVFVDASHDYLDVKRDIDAWWPRLADGGVMAGHDFRYKVGGVREAVAGAFAQDVFLDSDTVWWALK